VYQPYASARGEAPFAPGSSTGLACGSTWQDAEATALREVVERDAVTLAWLARLRPPRIEIEGASLDEDVRRMIEVLDARGFRWAAFDLTTDLGLPVAAALIEGSSSVGRVTSFGSACHADRMRALAKALVEAAHARMYVKSLLRESPGWRAGRKFQRVVSFADHARFYSSHPEHGAALEAWWRSPCVVRWPRDVPRRPAGAPIEAYVVDITTPDVRGLGFHVARVLAPGLQPLHGNHAWPHLAGPRLGRLRQVFGPRARRPLLWNRHPHPCA
jgi:ribosomal protein S12 methylthiotransferase accessory factor